MHLVQLGLPRHRDTIESVVLYLTVGNDEQGCRMPATDAGIARGRDVPVSLIAIGACSAERIHTAIILRNEAARLTDVLGHLGNLIIRHRLAARGHDKDLQCAGSGLKRFYLPRLTIWIECIERRR
ncbi:hypothetical protein PPGU16_84200 (plasmid) [Paraburkholderia largidicola]|uniref:Uncharacterized protein n=1 Tax=Paraburkholderia largidicola TaxID=3014751 RepID=A0A7I8C3F9_9BURK|nr:hypothetical protein PPGU16_84200 [Paraburkholderia sp. PGU16]